MYERPFNDYSFEEFLKEGKLMGSRCSKCNALALPPRPICVSCSGSQMEWMEFKGKGKLVAFTDIVVAPPTMAKEGFGRNNPYVVGVIEMEEGAKMVGRIVGVDAKKPETIRVETPLRAEFIHSGQGADRKTNLVFKPYT